MGGRGGRQATSAGTYRDHRAVNRLDVTRGQWRPLAGSMRPQTRYGNTLRSRLWRPQRRSPACYRHTPVASGNRAFGNVRSRQQGGCSGLAVSELTVKAGRCCSARHVLGLGFEILPGWDLIVAEARKQFRADRMMKRSGSREAFGTFSFPRREVTFGDVVALSDRYCPLKMGFQPARSIGGGATEAISGLSSATAVPKP
jgi:hypothetical protein